MTVAPSCTGAPMPAGEPGVACRSVTEGSRVPQEPAVIENEALPLIREESVTESKTP